MSLFLNSKLSASINKALSFDDNLKNKLFSHSGKSMAIYIKGIDYYLLLDIGMVDVVASIANERCNYDASVSSSPMQFKRLLASNFDLSAASGVTIEISGDSDFAATVLYVMRNIEIDWYNIFSGKAQLPFFLASTAIDYSSKIFHYASGNASKNIVEYLQEEACLLPQQHQLDSFCDEVTRLRDDTQLIAAKISILAQQLDKDE